MQQHRADSANFSINFGCSRCSFNISLQLYGLGKAHKKNTPIREHQSSNEKCEIRSFRDDDLGLIPYTGKRQWLVTSLIIILIAGWTSVAAITQNYFLWYSIPALSNVLVYALNRLINAVFPTKSAKSTPLPGEKQ